MENDNLIKNILLQIGDNPDEIDKKIFVAGYDYNSEILPKLIFLYDNGLIFANPQKDESGDIVQLYVDKLTPKGKRYLQSLS